VQTTPVRRYLSGFGVHAEQVVVGLAPRADGYEGRHMAWWVMAKKDLARPGPTR